MSFEDELGICLAARFPIIHVPTLEEERAIEVIKAICANTQRQCLAWDGAEGFCWITPQDQHPPIARDPITALEVIDKADPKTSAVFVLKDFHEYWGNPQIKRKLRSLSQRLKYTKKYIISVATTSHIPDELKDEIAFVDFPLPDPSELLNVLSGMAQTLGVKINLTPLGKEKMVQAALGLTVSQAKRVYSKAIVTNRVLDDRAIDLVTAEKKQLIRESEALEYYSVTENLGDVGGLNTLKEWLSLRESAFGEEARQYGLPVPKGISLLGIPGTGKSLTAKMIGRLWQLPLLRLDVGSLFGSLVGESEERARRALRLAETVAPCVLWIDEIEKALAHGGLDSGTSARVFGSILTWMQEKTAAVFVVATANDISSLPPELLRKGRFDEIFFLDLPNKEERKEIFAVHLRKRNRLPIDYDLDQLTLSSEGYVGAEIEQAIIDAMYSGFNDKQREFTTDDILDALKRQVPLSVSQREIISALRAWQKEGRAISASASQENSIPSK